MKITTLFIVILALAGERVAAQQPGLATSSRATPAAPAVSDERLSGLLSQTAQATEQDTIVTKQLKVSGPLVRPFKATRFWEFPRRLVHLINPFARSEPREEPQAVRELSPRAWSTVVGWHPGQSAFPDALTHESSMGLISLGRP